MRRSTPSPTAGSSPAWPAVIAEVDGLLEQFEFGKACEALYHFAWDEFCDWYLELAKVPLASGDEAAAARTRAVLGFVLDQMLRLLHPVMPFVTDELWCALTGEDSVMMAAWPAFGSRDAGGRGRDRVADAAGDRDPPVPVRPGAAAGTAGARPARRHRGHAARGARGVDPVAAAPDRRSRTQRRVHRAARPLLAEGVTVELDLAGTVDVAAERKRLERDLAAARKEAQSMTAKLGNEAFTAKAPADVIEKSRAPARRGRGGHRPPGEPARRLGRPGQ